MDLSRSGSALALLTLSAGVDAAISSLTGSKIWTSYAEHADHCALLVPTEPDLRSCTRPDLGRLREEPRSVGRPDRDRARRASLKRPAVFDRAR